jgi:S-adenosylmethionine:tRNA ribosyltransferase-isomerase
MFSFGICPFPFGPTPDSPRLSHNAPLYIPGTPLWSTINSGNFVDQLFTTSRYSRVRTADFAFHLPDDLIAQAPMPRRDGSRLLVLHRDNGVIEHRTFSDLPGYLRPGDVLVLNDSKVFPARLRARNPATGGAFEILLLEENAQNDWWAMMRPAKRARVGAELEIVPLSNHAPSISATVLATNDEGHRRLKFSGAENFAESLKHFGEVPLPPYIKRPPQNQSEQDRERYQTVYARERGSVAAPTAGLHFTPELLDTIRARGVEVCHVTLHVGPGTFAPVKAEHLEQHVMHHERYELSPEAAQKIQRAKSEQRRVIAVGTTSVRVLESIASARNGAVMPAVGRTNIFIFPPYQFRVVDGLVTNFHLPESTLLMLASAFAAPGEMRGRELMLGAYAIAIEQRYAFFSYGDAMFIS